MELETSVSRFYDRMSNIECRLSEVETAQPFLKEMIERNIQSNETLGHTMLEIQKSIVNINNKMDTQTQSLNGIKLEAEKTNEEVKKQISEVSQKIATIEEKGKFDIRDWLRGNFPWIVILVGLGIYSASQFFSV